VPADRIQHYLSEIPEQTLVAKVRADGRILYWFSEPRRWRKIATETYASSLEEALDANEQELAGRGFSARYGRVGPSGRS
jgi:hypothetical protein